MTHILKRLLGNDHPLFAANLAELERASGNAGIDTRLVADITEKAHAVLRAMRLDPADSHGREVYQALISAVRSQKAAELLADTDFVLFDFNGDVVSFNIVDVIENAHHQLPYESRSTEHGLRHLRAEIVRRYADHERTDTELVHKIADHIGLKPARDEGHPDIRVTESKAPHILAIGEIFTDAFIKLNEDVARVDTDPDGSKRISLPLGSKPPYDGVDIIRAVGPSPNAAVSFHRLGLRASLRSFMGNDEPGVAAKDHLEQEGIDTDLLSLQSGMQSNYYYVLRYGAERTILVKNQEYEYAWQEPLSPPDWIYLSLIGDASWQLHQDMLDYLDAHPETKLAFQPGTFHFAWGVERLKDVYKHSHIVVMNREEAMEVTGRPHEPIRDLANGLHDLGPQIVVITDGPHGSYASYDWKLVTIPNYPDPAPPLDRTGAGDAFASTIVAALALGETMDTALTWAPINSMSVVQHLGAQAGLLPIEKIKDYLSKAPADYKLTEVQE